MPLNRDEILKRMQQESSKKNRSDLTTENMQFVFLTRNKTTNDIVSDLKDISNVIFPQKNSGDK